MTVMTPSAPDHLRAVYAQKALSQIPRLLGNQDRNPYSPTYGCFHRDYWLDKTSDFPDAVRQFSTHALALVATHAFPGNPYYGQAKIRDWAIAGLDFWTKIQHRDGSFDEFYPYERGWVGPTAFTTYTSIETYTLLRDSLPSDIASRVRSSIERAAHFIAAGESEEDHLANHYALACMVVWKAWRLLRDPALKRGYEQLWQAFLGYYQPSEGWSREYDGVDPGYLSATVSFLAKLYQDNPNPDLLEVLRRSVSFSRYFVYPNGFYGGSIGSRNTLHFYPHGYEILGREMPLALTIADRMLVSLSEQKLVPPEIMSDRYVLYRVPEYLQAYLDYTPRPPTFPPLPYEETPFTRYFPLSRIFVATRPHHYIVANLAKGGVVKVFDYDQRRLLINDCGIIGRLRDGRVITSQWIDPEYHGHVSDDGWSVSGSMQVVPSNKLFTPLTHILFRTTLLALGWNTWFSHTLKGGIRKTLMLGRRPIPLRFMRRFQIDGETMCITDTLQCMGDIQVQSLSVGDEFFVRYVPQSRYFQLQELEISAYHLTAEEIRRLNAGEPVSIVQQLPPQ